MVLDILLHFNLPAFPIHGLIHDNALLYVCISRRIFFYDFTSFRAAFLKC